MSRNSGRSSEPIAIIGLSCRFPGADNDQEFWNLLYNGHDVVQRQRHTMQPKSTDNGGFNDDSGGGTPARYLKCAIDKFDANFFHINRKEAELMDPQQRLVLEASWESLENACIDPHSLAGSNASVFLGMSTSEYAKLDASCQKANVLSVASARISQFLGLCGASITMEAGCASSLEAIHYACESLRNGTTDLVLSGGVNLVLNPGRSGDETNLGCEENICKIFYASASEEVSRGEACVMMVLKRLSDALRNKNEILGLISGSAVNSNNIERATASEQTYLGRLGTPNAEAQEQVIRQALTNAGILPHEVGYIEEHGAGTLTGDAAEFHALHAVFGNDPNRSQPLLVGSIKTHIGNTEGASGASGLVNVLLAMKHRMIPKHLNFGKLKPDIDLDSIPAVIPLVNTEWMPCSKQRGLVAGISSFGLSGTNVHLIVHGPPLKMEGSEERKSVHEKNDNDNKVTMERSCHILVLSACAEKALAELAKGYADLLEDSNQAIQLPDLAFTTYTSRAHLMPHRLALVAEDSAQALVRLRSKRYLSSMVTSTSTVHKIGFLFTGQGSHYVGMAKELNDSHPYFRLCFQTCCDLLHQLYSLDLSTIVWSGHMMNEYSQVALFCIEYCLAKLWQSFGVHPTFALGHGTGEFAAAVMADLISLEDGLKLVVEQTRLVNSLPTLFDGGAMAMLVVNVSRNFIEQLIADFEIENLNISSESGETSPLWIDVVALNSQDEIVVSGSTASVVAFQRFCRSRPETIQTQRITMSAGGGGQTQGYMHSRAVDPILEGYARVVASIMEHRMPQKSPNATRVQTPKFISGALAKGDVEPDSKYWVSHLRKLVDFEGAFALLVKAECNIFVEIGPQSILLNYGMSSLPMKTVSNCTWCPSLRKNEGNWMTMLTSLGRMYTSGLGIDWNGFDSPYRNNRQRISPSLLPNYPFQRERYWYTPSSNDKTKLDILKVNSKSLHPWLGRRVPLPCPDIVLYYNSIHKIEDKLAVLSPAGLLEIVFAAKFDLISDGGFNNINNAIPLNVEDFKVDEVDDEAHLPPVEEDIPIQIQTTVQTTTNAEGQIQCKVTIYKQTTFESGDNSVTWRRLASATFFPCASIANLPLDIDLNSFRSSLTPASTTATMSLIPGLLFRHASNMWQSDKMILLEISMPKPSTRNWSSYVCHPFVLDLMIQAITGCTTTTGLQHTAHVCIEKFATYRRNNTIQWTPTLNFLIIKDSKESDQVIEDQAEIFIPRITVYNEHGEFLAMIEGLIDFLAPTMETIHTHHIQRRAHTIETIGDQWSSETRAFVISLQIKFAAAVQRSAELTYLYILKAIRDLGWSGGGSEGSDGGGTVSIPIFAHGANVRPQFIQLLRRWFQILEEEGDVVFVDDRNSVLAAPNKIFLKTEELELRIKQCIACFSGKMRLVECQFVMNFGERLVDLIQGKVSPFTLLFPEKQDDQVVVGVEEVYTKATFTSSVHKCAAEYLRTYMKSQLSQSKEGVSRVIKLLEVGAGTGSLTAFILKELEQLGLPYEYTFTDISQYFLKLATQRFGTNNKNIKFKLLDIESDPCGQGFAANSFDIVLADDVLHATKDLGETVQNVRRLLVPGSSSGSNNKSSNGRLILVEVVHRVRELDISFGFLDGWWRFTDHELRPDYPCIDAQGWEKLLLSNGFDRVERNGDFEVFKALDLIVAWADK